MNSITPPVHVLPTASAATAISSNARTASRTNRASSAHSATSATSATSVNRANSASATAQIPNNLLSHPQLWRAGQLTSKNGKGQHNQGLASGYAALDAHLPGGGWPKAGLAEVLHAQPGLGELRLLAPMLADLSQEENRWIAWINPPAIPYAPALGRFGIRSDRLLMVHPKTHTDALWAAEQAARSGTCSAVLIWLDESALKNAETRRLQIAAKQGGSLACLFRPTQAAQHASAAELRLCLHAHSARSDHPPKQTAAQASDAPNTQASSHSSYSGMQVDILKRRGGWAIDNIDIHLVGDDPIRRLHDIQQQLSLWQSESSAQPSVHAQNTDRFAEPLPEAARLATQSKPLRSRPGGSQRHASQTLH